MAVPSIGTDLIYPLEKREEKEKKTKEKPVPVGWKILGGWIADFFMISL